MNILEIILGVFTIVLAVSGFRKGFVRKLASMLSLVLSVALVSAALPYVTDFLRNETPVYEYIVDKSDEIVAAQAAELLQKELPDNRQISRSEAEGAVFDRADQTELIDELPVPLALKDMLLDYNNEEGYKNLQASGFLDYVSRFIASMILNAIAFLVSVLLVQIILRVAIAALDLLAHAPILHTVNRMAGMLLGLLQALAGIWIFFLIVSMISGTEAGLQLLGMIQESRILSGLYESNLFVKIVLKCSVFL